MRKQNEPAGVGSKRLVNRTCKVLLRMGIISRILVEKGMENTNWTRVNSACDVVRPVVTLMSSALVMPWHRLPDCKN